jgi:hypothetical protein
MNPSAPITDPGPDPVTGLDPWPTLANARNNSVISARNNASTLNASVLTIYMGKFNDWAQQVVAGKIDNTNPPQPPPAWATAIDPATGYSYVEIGTAPICAMPPIPGSHVQTQPVPPPHNLDIGPNIAVSGEPSAYFSVGPMDSWPIGKTTPPNARSSDGVTGTFLRLGAAVGAGWYEKVG